MKEGAPVRFLLLVLAGWSGLRVVTLSADGWRASPAAEEALPSSASTATQPATATGFARGGMAQAIQPSLPTTKMASPQQPRGEGSRLAIMPSSLDSPPAMATWPESVPAAPYARAPAENTQLVPAPSVSASTRSAPQRSAPRWSGSAWALARRDGGAALAPGGTLGGSQAGARLLYRINSDAARPIAVSARAYMPLRRTAGAEAALGLDWQPSPGLPVHFLVERRQRLGPEGRSAFAASLYGGASAALGRRWRLDFHAQAGIVGTRSRDAFFDGAARLSRRVGPVEAGAAAWGAAQPGASRLDAGPLVTLPLRARDATLRLSAEYRFRIAGDARPASGPTLALGVDF